MERIEYTPPPTVNEFIKWYTPGALFYSWLVGPLGSGKTTGDFMKLVYMAKLQRRGADGVRRTRCVIVRNTRPQLKDTTERSWFAWFKDGIAGKWKATEHDFILKFDDVICEVMFRPLDTPEDIARVLSLEVTFAIIDEFVEIRKEIIDALSGRLGRYPAEKDGGATNWGMWGASNPSTEDNWWFDYLHNKNAYEEGTPESANVQLIELFGAQRTNSMLLLQLPPPGNVRYFHQPPGDSIEAENIEHLPGKRDYYVNQMKGKSPAWIEQFVRAIWGFSASNTPVVKSFQPIVHVQRMRLRYTPTYKLVIGFDPGIGGCAAIFGQEDMYGRLLVLGEVGTAGMGAKQFMRQRVKPYMQQHFPGADFVFAPDPAAASRQPNDATTAKQAIESVFGQGCCSIETNNRLSKRLDAIESFTNHRGEMGESLQIDAVMCPMLIRALSGGWKYERMARQDTNRHEPEKNSYSHYGDGFGYLCRYFDKRFERSGQRGLTVDEVADQVRFQHRSQRPRYHFQ